MPSSLRQLAELTDSTIAVLQKRLSPYIVLLSRRQAPSWSVACLVSGLPSPGSTKSGTLPWLPQAPIGTCRTIMHASPNLSSLADASGVSNDPDSQCVVTAQGVGEPCGIAGPPAHRRTPACLPHARLSGAGHGLRRCVVLSVHAAAQQTALRKRRRRWRRRR